MTAPTIDKVEISSDGTGINIYIVDISGQNLSFSSDAYDSVGVLYSTTKSYTENPLFIACPLPSIYNRYSIKVVGVDNTGNVTPYTCPFYYPEPTVTQIPQPVIENVKAVSDGLSVSFTSTDVSGENISYTGKAIDCKENKYEGTSTDSPMIIKIPDISKATVECPYLVMVTENKENNQSFPSYPNYYPIPSSFPP